MHLPIARLGGSVPSVTLDGIPPCGRSDMVLDRLSEAEGLYQRWSSQSKFGNMTLDVSG